MIGNVLLFLGFILLIIPTWMSFKLFLVKGEKRSSNDLMLILGNPQEPHPLVPVIRAFQIWGGFWIVCGMAIKIIGEGLLEGTRGTLIYTFVFLMPILLITVAGSRKKRGEHRFL